MKTLTKITLVGIGTVAVISLIGANAKEDQARFDPPSTAQAVAEPAADNSGLNSSDAATLVWIETAEPAMDRIIALSQEGSDAGNNGDLTGMLASCIGMGDAGSDLMVNAPANSIGDEARAVGRAFQRAAGACADGDVDAALPYLTTANEHMNALTDELQAAVTRLGG